MSPTSQSLRRSRRGQNHTFAAGDKVEVLRDDGIEIGTLLHPVEEVETETSSPSGGVTHWVVQFSRDTDEISEKNLGRLVETVASEADGNVRSDASPDREFESVASQRPSRKTTTGKRHSGTKDPNKVPKARVSTRATAKQNGMEPVMTKETKTAKRAARRSTHDRDENESVVAVKMLTGTLYLYRGKKPRAEFVWVV